MCKVLMIAGIKPENNAKAIKFIKVMAPLMSTYNRDGLGYSAVDKDGNMFSERWLSNESAFLKPEDVKVPEDPPEVAAMLAALGDVVKLDTLVAPPTIGEYGSLGNVDLTKMVAITMHTRAATSAKGFQNVHPFIDVEKDTSLIHNGIIRNEDEFKFTLSTCDSESLLISYLKHEVNVDMTKMQAAMNDITGYYACGVLTRDETGARVLDYFKGNGAGLHTAFINELGTYVITTSASDIKDACAKLKYTCSNIFSIVEGWLVRLNPVTGVLLKKEKFIVGSEYNAYRSKYWGPETQTQRNSWEGAKVYTPTVIEPKVIKDKNLSKASIEYMKLPATGRVFSLLERREYMDAMLEAAQ